MNLLNIFLEDFRGPTKTVFLFKIVHLTSAGNHGALRAKCKDFQGLVVIPNMEKILLWEIK